MQSLSLKITISTSVHYTITCIIRNIKSLTVETIVDFIDIIFRLHIKSNKSSLVLLKDVLIINYNDGNGNGNGNGNDNDNDNNYDDDNYNDDNDNDNGNGNDNDNNDDNNDDDDDDDNDHYNYDENNYDDDINYENNMHIIIKRCTFSGPLKPGML